MTDDEDADNDTTHDFGGQRFDDVPAYLLRTNKAFLRAAHQVLTTTTSSISVDDLQLIALLMHRIAALYIQKQITHVYLRSGTGKLRQPAGDLMDIDRRVWPVQVTSAMVTKRAKANPSSATAITADTDGDQLEYESLVNERLQEIKQQMKAYKQQLDEKKSQLMKFTPEMEEALVHYVQHYGLVPLQMKRDLKTALLQHHYDATLLDRKYAHAEPNAYQVSDLLYCMWSSDANKDALISSRFKLPIASTKPNMRSKRPNGNF